MRNLPTFEHRVVLVLPCRRLWCEHCGGPRLERLSWLDRYRRVTDRLAEACRRFLEGMTIQGVARFYGLGWHTIKDIGKEGLAAALVSPDWSRIRYLAMDEFALHKGHHYATVLVEPTRSQVLWIGPGRSRETARAFFKQLPAGAAERVEAVAIDMTTAYELEIRAPCPQAEVVYDLFHVVDKFGCEVIDRIRVDEANRLSQDKAARKVIKRRAYATGTRNTSSSKSVPPSPEFRDEPFFARSGRNRRTGHGRLVHAMYLATGLW